MIYVIGINTKNVRNYCQLRGQYRGEARRIYTINLKPPQNIPVLCHNMSGYDTHLYIKELAKKCGKVYVIANTDEQYLNYSINSRYGYELDEKGNKENYKDIFRRCFQNYGFFNKEIN